MILSIFHPTNGHRIDVEIDPISSIDNLIKQLIEHDFIPQEYNYYIQYEKDGVFYQELNLEKTLSEIGLTDFAFLQLIFAADESKSAEDGQKTVQTNDKTDFNNMADNNENLNNTSSNGKNSASSTDGSNSKNSASNNAGSDSKSSASSNTDSNSENRASSTAGSNNNNSFNNNAGLNYKKRSKKKARSNNKVNSNDKLKILGVSVEDITSSVSFNDVVNNKSALQIFLYKLSELEREISAHQTEKENEYKSTLEGYKKLQEQLQSCQSQMSDDKVATILSTAATPLVGIGCAFIEKYFYPSFFVVAIGIVLTFLALWLHFRKY